jgi:hypothetical protein
MSLRLCWIGVLGLLASVCGAQPTVRVLPGEQMRINVAATTVVPITGGWELTLPMLNDNGGAYGVTVSFTQWWHFELTDLNPAGERLVFRITGARYSDTILPVASVNGGRYARLPATATPTRTGSSPYTFTFSWDVPPGTTTLRVAKYFPYTLPMYEAFRGWYRDAAFAGLLDETVIGQSVEGRPIHLMTVTDKSVPDDDKVRVWIHTAVHPAETQAYFCTEGLTTFLLSGDPFARAILRRVIFNIVPMANPDGVALGNYRTNARSVNLENEWYAPYNSTVPETLAMRLKIEEFMGTEDNVGSNPILLLLNLHSSHGLTYPFHFVHQGTWFQPGDPGAKPSVNAIERRWVDLLKARSPYVALGNSQNSTFNHPTRPYVESMMHDRYSVKDAWEDVMAITFEGTYQAGPVAGVPNTDDDYRAVGWAIGQAIGDYFGIPEPTPGDAWLIY